MTMPTVPTKTREEWLTDAGVWFMEDILEDDKNTPWRVSVGWPKGVRGSKGGAVLGCCHPRSHSTDQHNELFISPTTDNSVSVLATLAHELIHAYDDCKSGHKGAFKRLALKCGLEGKMTATTAGAELQEALEWYVQENGEMPHAAMTDEQAKPKQGTRMIKVTCDHCDDFTVRASRKVVDAWQLSDSTSCPICTNPLNFEA
jgi:hypothetical protein